MKEKYEGLVDHFVGNGMKLEEAVELLERAMIARTLENTGGNRCAASRLLGVHRNTLQRKIEQYKLDDAPAGKKLQGRATARRRRERVA
jgi:DNA-binding NtrC family response regulator